MPFLASGSFPLSRLFAWGGQSIGASASVLPMNIQGWFPLRLTGLISLQYERCSRIFSSTTIWKHQFFSAQLSLWLNSQMTTGKTIALTIQAFVGKMMSLLFNKLFRFAIAFHILLIGRRPSFLGKDGRDGDQRKAQAVHSRLPVDALSCQQMHVQLKDSWVFSLSTT